MDRNRWLMFGGILVLAALLVVGAFSISNKAAAEKPTPTAGPTEKPAPTKVTVLGGQIFVKVSHDYLLEHYNIDAQYVSVGSFEMTNYDKLNEVDAIWPGSASAYEDFTSNHPGMVKDHETVFRTYEMLFTRKDLYLPALLKSGVVYEKNGAYFAKLCPLAAAMDENKSWKDLGADIPGLVNINYSAPERSSGGLQHLFLVGGCLVPGGDGGNTVLSAAELGSKSDSKSVLSRIMKNWEDQPLQDTASPEWFNSYVIKSSTYVMAASSESLYLGWYNNLPEARRNTDGNLIVGIYPEWSIATDQILAGLNDKGNQLVNIYRTDPYLQTLGWTSYGMRTAVGGIGAKPGDTKITWIKADPQAIGEPKKDVFDAIKAALAGK